MRVQTQVILSSGDGSFDEYLVTVSGEVDETGDGIYELRPRSIRLEEAKEVDTLYDVDVLQVTDLFLERLELEERNSPRFPNTIKEALEDAAYERGTRTNMEDTVVEMVGPKVRICAHVAGAYQYYRVSWELDPGAWTVGFYAETLTFARKLAREKAVELGSHLQVVR